MTRKRKHSVEPFGQSIERLMADSGLTYRGLAARTGLSAGYLNHLVHGNRPVPSAARSSTNVRGSYSQGIPSSSKIAASSASTECAKRTAMGARTLRRPVENAARRC